MKNVGWYHRKSEWKKYCKITKIMRGNVIENIIFLFVGLVIYIGILILMGIELKDVLVNGEKYIRISGWNKYKNSIWYEKISDAQKRNSKSALASLIVWGVAVSVGLTGYWKGSSFIQEVLFVPKEAETLFLESKTWMIIIVFIWIFVMTGWLSFHSSVPIMIAVSRTFYPYRRRYDAWKNMLLITLPTSVIALFFIILSINSYSYLDADKIVINRFFSLTETEYLYTDIEYVESSYDIRKSKRNTNYVFEYVLNMNDGKHIKYEDKETVKKVHRMCLKKNVDIRKEEISFSTCMEIGKRYGYEWMGLSKSLFEVID